MIYKRFLVIIMAFTIIAGLNLGTCQAAVGTPLEIAEVGTLMLPAGLDITDANDTETKPGLSSQYDLVCLSNDTWHYGRLVVFKDKRDMGLAAEMFNQGIQNRQVLKVLSDAAKDMIEKNLTNNGSKLLQWYSPKTALIGKHKGLSLAARFTATDKLPMPLYASMYFYMPSRQLVGLAIICPDSDRQYWDPLFRDSVANLEY